VKLKNKYLKYFFAWCFGSKIKGKLIKGGVESEKREIISYENFLQGLKKLKSLDYEFYLFLFLLYNTGARRGALLNLRFDGFTELTNGSWRIRYYESKSTDHFIKTISK
jgi:integrase